MDKKKLKGKVIDCHNHIGVSIKAYACLEYPYAETVESLYCKQQSAGVDVSIIFPFTPDLHFNLRSLISKGINISDRKPFSEVPFGLENNLIMYELSRFNPEYRENFIPFVSADPMRKIDAQIKYLESLEKKYPIYGIKINPTSSQSRIDSLLKKGEPLLKYARERNIPFLFHTSPSTDDYYSYVGDSLKVIEKNPDVRFILAHAIVFHKGFLDIADSMPNVWVDTAALKIQVDLFNKEKHGEKYQSIDADFSDYKKVMQKLMELYPNTIIWGSDSPAYSYICRRKHNKNRYIDFNYKGSYKGEKDALDSLPKHLKVKASNTNTINWLFG